MCRNIDIFSSKEKGFSWWWLGVKVGVVTALIIWWWLENQNKKFLLEESPEELYGNAKSIPLPEDDTPQGEGIPVAEALQVEMPAVPVVLPTEPDDLTIIEGIGPKINAALQESGIRTFSQLAASKRGVLHQILLDAGIRIGFPETWPEQAALAAKADWAALEGLQNGLQGGRRVD